MTRGGRPAAQASARAREGALLGVPAVTTALLVNLPLVYLFYRAVEAGWTRYAAEVLAASTLRLVAETLLLVAGVLAVSLALALPMAWLVARTDLPGRRFWAVAGALPLAFPSYVSAFAIVAVFGPRGFVQGWIEPLGVERLPELAYGFSGAVLALSCVTYPYLYLPMLAQLRGMDPALEESARCLGCGRWGVFVRVILPQLRAPLYAGALLVALYTISDFGAVSIVRYNTLTLGIYNAYGALFDRGVAAILSTVLVGLTLLFVVLQGRLLRHTRAGRTRTARPASPVALGRWRRPCQLALAATACLTLGVPVGVSVFWGVRAWIVGNPLGPDGLSALHSLGLALAAAASAVSLAVPLAAWAVRHPGRWSRLTERISYSGNALPGLVVALALVFFATRFVRPMYQSLGLLVGAYLVRFLPEATAAVHAALADVGPVFEEAARSLGRGPIAALRSVTLPMIRPGLLAGAGLVFLTTMKELPVTLILRPIGFETLATRVWSAAGEGVFSEAAVPALLLLTVSAGPVYLLVIRPMLPDGP